MSSNLKKIQQLAASVRDNLASLKPSSGLDDLDAIAKERTLLREKLDLLADAETAEREKLEAEEAAAKAKQRRVLLQTVAEKTETAVASYQELTDRAASLVGELVETLAKREQVFNRKAVGLDSIGILNNEEHRALLAKLESSAVGVYPGDFGNTWREAVARTCPDNQQLRRQLYALAVTPGNYQDKPLSGARPVLAESARTLAANEPAEHTKAPTVAAAPAKASGDRYEVDLRNPGRVTDLNAD